MHKNSEQKNQERLNLIMDTALRLYREKSASEVSVLDICQACSMTKPTFYKYVSSKESILAHYFQGSAEEVGEAMELLPQEDHLGRVLYGMSHVICSVQGKDIDLLRDYINHCLRNHIPSHICASNWEEALKEELSMSQKSSQIQTDSETDIVFKSLKAMVLGMGIESVCEEEDEDLYQQFIRLSAHFLKAPKQSA